MPVTEDGRVYREGGSSGGVLRGTTCEALVPDYASAVPGNFDFFMLHEIVIAEAREIEIMFGAQAPTGLPALIAVCALSRSAPFCFGHDATSLPLWVCELYGIVRQGGEMSK